MQTAARQMPVQQVRITPQHMPRHSVPGVPLQIMPCSQIPSALQIASVPQSQVTVPPHPSSCAPHSPICAHVLGLQPHVFGLPSVPPPHVSGGVHCPQLSVAPHPSLIVPHSAPAVVQVLGAHVSLPH